MDLFNPKRCNSQLYNQSLEIVWNSSVMEFSLHTHTVLSPFCKINCCECLKLTFLLVFTQVMPLTLSSEIWNDTQPVKKFLTILWNLRFLTMFITCCHWFGSWWMSYVCSHSSRSLPHIFTFFCVQQGGFSLPSILLFQRFFS